MATIPQKVLELIATFERNADEYRAADFNEANLRIQFVNPLFKTLGWDMDNTAASAEAYKDVIHEASLKIGAETKAPDYCFRIGGTPKFYLEAKKPAVNIKDAPEPAFQLRRYGWSKKLPLSILTDFEEFAVYDCRYRPALGDKASDARIKYLRYTDYAKEWDYLVGNFSKDAILKGAFDKYAVSNKSKRGTATVDTAILQEIEEWRFELAKNLALRNRELTSRELNYAVQITIDRIIFLRMCEDRGIEPYGQLRGLMSHANIYAELVKLYERADQRYNSGLFHFSSEPDRAEGHDEWTPKLVIDDKVFKQIFRSLYYPDSPYEFSVLPAEILGQVYEQFLGKVIRLTESHQAKIEEKPEVKKAGGVYYTPTYIVDYIVEHTVGKLLGAHESEPEALAKDGVSFAHASGSEKPLTPKQARNLRILDPACGSGSFLLGAYNFLLKWYLDQYVADAPEKRKELFQSASGEWKLTTAERKRILVSNLYGVDIDPQAVEVTKLSLLLKVLEGESQETLNRQLRLFHERALPDLASNIKCGNSLIGPDFYAGQQPTLFDDEEKYRINVFDWNAAFPEIMKAGGFDAVIGNPPYGADYDDPQKLYFQARYVYKEGKPETYLFFIDRAMSLLKEAGTLGYITPNAWLTNHYGVQLRRHVLERSSLQNLVDLEPTKVFEDAVVDTAIITLAKRLSVASNANTTVWQGTKDRNIVRRFSMDQAVWLGHEQAVINLQANPAEVALLARLEGSKLTLNDLVEFSQGVIPYESKVEGDANKYIAEKPRGDGWYPLLESASQVRRYFVEAPRAFIHFGPWLCRSREQRFFSEPKILFHRLRKKLPIQLVGAIDESGVINRHALSNLILRSGSSRDTLRAVLGLFNSKLANWWFVKTYGVLMEVGRFKVNKLPLPTSWAERSAAIGGLVEQMLTLHKQLAAAKMPHDTTVLAAQIAQADRQIDNLIYERYGLSADEIKIVEEGTAT